MKTTQSKTVLRIMALLLAGLVNLPLLAACGGGGDRKASTPPPPVDDTRGGAPSAPASQRQPQVNKGMSTGQKVAVSLVGAAALYYLYNQHKNSKEQGPQGQYYLSKNGRVYYRDADKRVHWVTPPPEGIKVPAEEAQKYQEFQGYNGRPTGRDLTGLGDAPVPATP